MGLYALTATVILIFLWVPGALIHLWCIIDAARYKPRD